MPNFIDLTGKKVGRLTVLERAPNRGKNTYWKCQCECGNIKEIPAHSLNKGLTLSCGCLQRERARANYKDLTGHKFGRLTVLSKGNSKNKKLYWLCQCDCGKILEVRGDSLTTGNTTSCGCFQKEKFIEMASRITDITGKRFGRLTVLEQDKSKKYQRTHWICQCDCGNITSVTTDGLNSGKTQSCGCYQKEQSAMAKLNKPSFNRIDMANQRFSRLLVLDEEPVYDQKKSILFWHCQCDCGAKTWADGHGLRNGSIRSCGCLKSFGEELIGNILTDLKIKFEKEKTFKDLVNPNTKKSLRYDFYLPEYNTLIEFDGAHHFQETTYSSLQDVQYRDDLKNKWAKENKYNLIRIPYTNLDLINNDYILSILPKKG